MAATSKSEFTVQGTHSYNYTSATRWIISHVWRYKWLFIGAVVLSAVDFFAFSQNPVLIGKASRTSCEVCIIS